MKAVAMIPARAGSQGLKNKNILDLGGKPVLAHSIIPAINSSLIDGVYLNSDSDDYLKIGQNYGAIGYRRSSELGSSTASMKSVVADFCSYIKTVDQEIDCVVVLYPTYPFRLASDIDDFVFKFREIGANRSVVGLKEPAVHPCLIYCRVEEGGRIHHFVNSECNGLYRRQEYPLVHELTHWICVIPVDGTSTLNNQMINKDTYGYQIPKEKKIIDIDTEDDYLYAKYLCNQLPPN